jgi:hypothetical protein
MEAALEDRDRLWLKRDMDVLPGVNRLGRVRKERKKFLVVSLVL